MTRFIDPRTESEKIIFRENFVNQTIVESHGGVLTGTPSIANGAILNGTTDRISYVDSKMPVDLFTIILECSCISSTGTSLLFSQFESTKFMWAITVTDRDLGCYVSSDGSNASVRTSGYLLQNVKTHIALVVNNTAKTWAVYVNGVYNSVMTSGFSFTSLGSEKTIGGIGTGFYFNGKVYRADIIKGNMSAEEVQDDYNGSTFTEIDDRNIAVHLPMKSYYEHTDSKYYTRNLGNGNDILMGSDGVSSGTFPTKQDVGFSFDGGDRLTYYTNILDSAKNATIGGLINFTSDGSLVYIGYQYVSSSSNFMLYRGSSNTLGMSLENPSSSSGTISTTEVIGSNQIISVFATYDGDAAPASRIKIYVNGDEVSTSVTGVVPVSLGILSSASFLIGASFVGMMKDFVLDNKTWTKTQVREFHNRAFRRINQ